MSSAPSPLLTSCSRMQRLLKLTQLESWCSANNHCQCNCLTGSISNALTRLICFFLPTTLTVSLALVSVNLNAPSHCDCNFNSVLCAAEQKKTCHCLEPCLDQLRHLLPSLPPLMAFLPLRPAMSLFTLPDNSQKNGNAPIPLQ